MVIRLERHCTLRASRPSPLTTCITLKESRIDPLREKWDGISKTVIQVLKNVKRITMEVLSSDMLRDVAEEKVEKAFLLEAKREINTHPKCC